MNQGGGRRTGTIGGRGGIGLCGNWMIGVVWNANYSDLRNVEVIRRHNVECSGAKMRLESSNWFQTTRHINKLYPLGEAVQTFLASM